MTKKFLKLMTGAIMLSTSVLSFGNDDYIKVYQGLGQKSNLWVLPFKDSEGTPVYTINHVEAAVLFDEEGKILNVNIDTLEISTPNNSRDFMPHFTGWPQTEPYRTFDSETKTLVDGVTTEEFIATEIVEWKTKRERGENYLMNKKNNWDKQMNFYQKSFEGKTVEELEQEFKALYSDINGKPLKEKTRNKQDKAKYDSLTSEQKEDVADIVAGATMSIRDDHGDILGTIKEAYDNRVEVLIPVK